MYAKSLIVSEIFREASKKLKAKKCSFTEAEVVYLWKLACQLSENVHVDYFEPSEDSLKIFNSLIEKRTRGIPTPLIEGKTCFNGIDILLEPGVFIPRPETEELARLVFECASTYYEYPRILDIGTGTGAIAIYLARNLPHAEVEAIDINDKAVFLAKRNAQKEASSNLKIMLLSLSDVIRKRKRYDVIVSNPPYITEKEFLSLPREVIDWEPLESLYGGEDGLDFYREFAAHLPEILNYCGTCLFEFGNKQEKEVKRIFEKQGYTVTIHKDINEKNRFARVRIA